MTKLELAWTDFNVNVKDDWRYKGGLSHIYSPTGPSLLDYHYFVFHSLHRLRSTSLDFFLSNPAEIDKIFMVDYVRSREFTVEQVQERILMILTERGLLIDESQT